MIARLDLPAGLIIATLCLALGGCAGSRPNPMPENLPMQQAIDFNRRAEKAFVKGDYERALPLFRAALERDTAIENADGIALNRINVARTFAALGKLTEAHAALDQLLANAILPFTVERLSEAALLKARLYVQAGDLSAAAHWIGRADAECQGRCQQRGSLLLLRAQIALRSGQGQDQQALTDASAALAHFKEGAQPIEEANAQRLLGEIWLAKDQAASALDCFGKALALDREIGAPKKIGLDLLFLGQASRRANRIDDARTYYRRAAAVAQAGADKEAAVEAENRLRDLTPAEPPP